MRLSDNPTVEVVERLACSPEQRGRWSPTSSFPPVRTANCKRVEWLDGATAVAVGARFRGHNADPRIGEWQTESEIAEVEDGRRWGVVRRFRGVPGGVLGFRDRAGR